MWSMDRNQFCKYSTCPSREFFSGFQWQSSVLTGVHANECWELRYAWPANGGSKGGDEDVTFCEKNIKKVKYKRKAGRARWVEGWCWRGQRMWLVATKAVDLSVQGDVKMLLYRNALFEAFFDLGSEMLLRSWELLEMCCFCHSMATKLAIFKAGPGNLIQDHHSHVLCDGCLSRERDLIL